MKYRKSMLINSFEAFYLMLLATKQQIENGVFFNVNDEQAQKNEKIEQFQNRLYQFIKDKDAKIAYENGKLASMQFQEVIYIMVSLADELFLNIEWDGKLYWRTHLLEQKFFNSNQSGEKLLINLDNFLKERNAQNSEIGIIYLYALSLGFRGKLRYEQDLDFYLKALKENIFYTIYKQSPKLFKADEVLFSQAHENMFMEKQQPRDYSLQSWIKVAIAFCGIYLLASQVIWHVETQNVWSLLNKMKNKSEGMEK